MHKMTICLVKVKHWYVNIQKDEDPTQKSESYPPSPQLIAVNLIKCARHAYFEY